MSATITLPVSRPTVLRAVMLTLKRHEHLRHDPDDFGYPLSVPDLDRHLDLLAELSRGLLHDATTAESELQKRICLECPHQLPTHYCPLRPEDRCTARRHAYDIVAAVGGAVREQPQQS